MNLCLHSFIVFGQKYVHNLKPPCEADSREKSLWWQLCPVNGSLPPFLEQHVALGEVLAAKETTVSRQWGGVNRLQHMMLLLHR